MLTKSFTVYAIATISDEHCPRTPKEYFDSFEEAQKNSTKYADWWCSKGTCAIQKIVIGCPYNTQKVVEVWHLGKGEVIQHEIKGK